MALTNKSLFLYGYTIDSSNYAIDFTAASGGSILTASLGYGYYSLTDLLDEVGSVMGDADPTNTYVATADRSYSSGLQNRVTIQTSGSYLDLNFSTGPASANSAYAVLGYNLQDYTGATSYLGASTTGTSLVPTFVGYNYLDPNQIKVANSALNISTSGLKELIVFQVQQFFQVQFKYEPQSFVTSDWEPFLTWAIQQRYFDFTPDVTDSTTFYNSTLETTAEDSAGVGFSFTEMLPEFPFLFDTGLMKFRKKVT
jgi:hypothetical protein